MWRIVAAANRLRMMQEEGLFLVYDPNNVFAKILRGEAPAYRIYEDANTLAFLDIMPQSNGHTLVIPKAEAENIFDLTPDLLAATVISTQKVARAVREAFRPAGLMIGQLNGTGAGQTVFHFHFHIIPRYDSVSLSFHAKDRADPDVLEEHAEKIRMALQRYA